MARLRAGQRAASQEVHFVRVVEVARSEAGYRDERMFTVRLGRWLDLKDAHQRDGEGGSEAEDVLGDRAAFRALSVGPGSLRVAGHEPFDLAIKNIRAEMLGSRSAGISVA